MKNKIGIIGQGYVGSAIKNGFEDYFEVHDVVDNQLFVGKDPSFPYNENPWNPGLEDFGQNVSVIAKTFYLPADKAQITLER